MPENMYSLQHFVLKNSWTNSLKSKHTDTTGSINIFFASPIHGKKPEKPIFAISFIWFRTTTTFHNKICKEVFYQWNRIFFHRSLAIYISLNSMCQSKKLKYKVIQMKLFKNIIPTKWQMYRPNIMILDMIFPTSKIQTLFGPKFK